MSWDSSEKDPFVITSLATLFKEKNHTKFPWTALMMVVDRQTQGHHDSTSPNIAFEKSICQIPVAAYKLHFSLVSMGLRFLSSHTGFENMTGLKSRTPSVITWQAPFTLNFSWTTSLHTLLYPTFAAGLFGWVAFTYSTPSNPGGVPICSQQLPSALCLAAYFTFLPGDKLWLMLQELPVPFLYFLTYIISLQTLRLYKICSFKILTYKHKTTNTTHARVFHRLQFCSSELKYSHLNFQV